MANELLLVNPRRRRRKASPKRRRTTRRRRNPNGIGPYAAVARRRTAPVRRRRRNPVTVARRRRYRNPNGRGMNVRNIVNNMVMPAATAGAGAVGLDILWGFMPLPPDLKTGPMRHLVKGIGAIVLGQITGMVVGKRLGDNMAMGALTVTFHDAFRDIIAQTMPQVPLGYYSAGASAGYDPQLGYYVGGGNQLAPPAPAVENSELGYYVQQGVGSQY